LAVHTRLRDKRDEVEFDQKGGRLGLIITGRRTRDTPHLFLAICHEMVQSEAVNGYCGDFFRYTRLKDDRNHKFRQRLIHIICKIIYIGTAGLIN
jgi:hypothetical protein